MSFENKAVALVGFGASNKEMCDYLLKNGARVTIRNIKQIPVPEGTRLITENYLDTCEDLVFRSPVIRPDRIKIRGELTSEIAYALDITRGFKIGVTGSDGKTTTSTLIYEILKADKRQATLCGNIGTPAIRLASDSTEKTHTVCELSSFQLFDMQPRLDVAVLTNISENHLDWHKDMGEYIEAKRNIFKNASRSVLNGDCPISRKIKLDGEIALFSLDDKKDTRTQMLACLKNGYLECNGQKIIKADRLRLKGSFNLQNALCAIASVWKIASAEAIEYTLSTFEGVTGRMEMVDKINGVSFVCSSIDSTPSRTIATLSAFDISKCVLILGGYDKGVSYEPLKEATRGLKCAILCGANADKIEKSVKQSAPIKRANDLLSATELAYEMANEGDTVLLSPASASFDMFENYKERERKFKEIVRGLKWKKSKRF